MPLPTPRSVICSAQPHDEGAACGKVHGHQNESGPGWITKSPVFSRPRAMPKDCTALKITVMYRAPLRDLFAPEFALFCSFARGS